MNNNKVGAYSVVWADTQRLEEFQACQALPLDWGLLMLWSRCPAFRTHASSGPCDGSDDMTMMQMMMLTKYQIDATSIHHHGKDPSRKAGP